MPIVEFALDPNAQHRVQVHLPTEQSAAVTILLNRSILGFLASEEMPVGKDFRLPDNTFLNVRMVNGQPLVSRAGYLLPTVNAADINAGEESTTSRRGNAKLGGCLIAWLILNLVVIGSLTLVNFLAIFSAIAKETSPVIFLLFSLIGVVGLIGISLIFAWKKSGFYLTAAYVVLSFLLSIPFGLLDVRSFVPLVSITILYVYLNRSGIWEKMS
jgi:hypothetical protein